MRFVVSTERLGWPGKESSLFERVGVVQRQLVYPNDAEVPTATCHLQRSEEEPALCDHPWEMLIAVPGDPDWESIPEHFRCEACSEAALVSRNT